MKLLKNLYNKLSYRGIGCDDFDKISNNKQKEFKNREKKQSPINSLGEISRCNCCSSKFHWANNCPDIPEQVDRIYDYMSMNIVYSLMSKFFMI